MSDTLKEACCKSCGWVYHDPPGMGIHRTPIACAECGGKVTIVPKVAAAGSVAGVPPLTTYRATIWYDDKNGAPAEAYLASDVDQALSAFRGQLAEETAIVNRVWKALGIATYEQAGGKSIDEHVAALRGQLTEAREREDIHQQEARRQERRAAEAERQRDDLHAKYYELIYAVARKFPNESRHHTALRYIQQAETPRGEAQAALTRQEPQ